MSRGIIDLIQENKRRFYKGEIRNCFYEEASISREKRANSTIINKSFSASNPTSLWDNLKTIGQKFSKELFYEPIK
ncbi:MAG: hypothetical protein J7J72_03890 [Bacteroidales bacterium]|nr:hypothetical protein [Bacteroidales bacterium]